MQVVLLGILEVEIVVHGPAFGGNESILRGVDGDSIQPGVKGAIAAKGLQRAIRLHESLLCNVFGLGRIVHVTHD